MRDVRMQYAERGEHEKSARMLLDVGGSEQAYPITVKFLRA